MRRLPVFLLSRVGGCVGVAISVFLTAFAGHGFESRGQDSPASRPETQAVATRPAGGAESRAAVKPEAEVRIRGVRVSQEVDYSVFPAAWNPETTIHFEKIDAAGFEECRTLLEHCFRKYPENALAKELDAVHVLRELAYESALYPTMYVGRTLFVCGDASTVANRDREYDIHYSLASILLQNHSTFLDTSKWSSLLPVGFHYLDEVESRPYRSSEWAQEAKTDFDDGFVTWYCVSGRAMDFSSIAGNLFMNRPGFWRAVLTAPRLSKKTDLVIEFMRKWSPGLNYQYFRRLTSTPFAFKPEGR